ncbi:hypothetical protein VHEMI02135 [[Torrubiella] hemipterigena]|uniref:Uncharacterized protein n=1 Tax=[Torrubiella] hemipterigena TaxID=1531966 RepID=A0A0A1SNR6_9HYPO|nr:hypothetical protein VHEMI02135 [[Torrubiella] hemipterigena]
MRQASSALALAILAADFASGSPVAAPAPRAPCAQVADAWAARQPGVTPTVSAKLAHDCLTSVPIRRQDALNLLDSISPYLDWQSDPDFKADPPADYTFPAHDIYANLRRVRDNVANNRYTNEYDFQADLVANVFNPGHDGHMALYPDALARATRFGRRSGLVSLSSDGTAIPEIKFKADVASQGDAALTVTQINGKNAADFLLDEVRAGSGSQDIDAGYNEVFFQLATSIEGSAVGQHASGGRGNFIYQGEFTNYTMSDGSVRSETNIAKIVGDFSNVTDGASFYSKFCNPNFPKPAAAANNGVLVNGAIPGYPQPVIASRDGTISGYYLSGEGYNDTAVLTMLSFEPSSFEEFQDVTAKFLSQATQDGKSKLILDVQANGGGYIFLGYDLFRQLFPNTIQEANSRWKANKAFLGVAKVYGPYAEQHPGTLNEEPLNWHADLNRANQGFSSLADKFGPNNIRTTPYTNLMRYDFDQFARDGLTIAGYGNKTGGVQPFDANNIVLLYDGYCASTCTIASELLKRQGGVKSVVFGGRPTRDAMQGVGGVKGAQVLTYSSIYDYIKNGRGLSRNNADLKEFARYNTLADSRTIYAGINVRDAVIEEHVADGLPSQFVYEAADCRKYWTKDMLTDITNVWKATADSAFNGAACVQGGIQRGNDEARTVVPRVATHVDKVIEKGTHFIQGNYPAFVPSQEFEARWLQKVPKL